MQWSKANLPISVPRTLTENQFQRYVRQIILPDVGEAGQLRLLDAKVLIVGMGGLGCPMALYLAASGVGSLGLVDDDTVDVSNLHRQVLYGEDSVGQAKVDVASQILRERNAGVDIEKVRMRIDEENAVALAQNYDVLVDATDSREARIALNRAAHRCSKPLVFGAVFRQEGIVGTIQPDIQSSHCFECLFPEDPPGHLAPTCNDAGVLPTTPGIVGLHQANEVLKLLLGVEVSSNNLLSMDLRSNTFTSLAVSKQADCQNPYCVSA